ncbi:futalosine hydrolase [Thermodesulforhabdus norvegica]|uniref:Futalosine hydrolase n=1 Tax=Thermodesulforhabdus norvegica TaxID=39841 RepID=A0A1I4SRG5_9BACT|nr:futalosine hydrolase [Thermodesulforhabdus norvegica]SFM66979.1 Phosphorylase superfamily protein [Thermodesulforhabdus norvegica]
MSGFRLGVVIPTELEMRPLLGTEFCEVFDFYGQMLCGVNWDDDLSVICVTTGIGKSNAAFTVAALFYEHKPHFLIHAGCAGTYLKDKVKVGDVVFVTEALFGDDGIMQDRGVIQSYEIMGIPAHRIGERSLFDRVSISEKLLSLFIEALPEGTYPGRYPSEGEGGFSVGGFRLHYGSALSVCSVSGSEDIAKKRYGAYGAVIEDLETASVMLACVRLGLPVIALRGVSNVAGIRDKKRWRVEEAMYNTGTIVRKSVPIIKKWLIKQELS